MDTASKNRYLRFLSTLSLRRATRLGLLGWLRVLISIHALLAESDLPGPTPCRSPGRFLSTLSLRRATLVPHQQKSGDRFLSTLSLRRATFSVLVIASDIIHFYPRSPCGERRGRHPEHQHKQKNFYPRSPCGERQRLEVYKRHYLAISIHALLAESDLPTGGRTFEINLFLSTLSLRRATTDAINGCNPDIISIHALLAESDVRPTGRPAYHTGFLSTLSLRRATPMASSWYTRRPQFLSTLSLRRATFLERVNRMLTLIHFYPRSPCGERPLRQLQFALRGNFYPRSPCGERPAWNRFTQRRDFISIHALLAESDMIHPRLCNAKPNFYPRSPCGERPQVFQRIAKPFRISIHALLAESDAIGKYAQHAVTGISIHALLAESDCSASRYFSIPS